MSRALDALQMKEEDVLQFLAAGIHLGGTNLDFQMERNIYQRKSDSICTVNLKRTERSFSWQLVPWLPLKALPVIWSRNAGQRAVLEFALEPLPLPATPLLEPSLTRSRLPSWSHDFWWVLIPGLTPSLSPRCLTLTWPPLLCVTHCPLHYVDIAMPCNNQGAHSVSLMCWMPAWEALCTCGTISCEHPWGVRPGLYFCRDPEGIEKEEQATTEKAGTKGEFQGERAAPAPKFSAAQPEVTGWSEGTGALRACSAVPCRRLVCSSHCAGHGMGRNDP